VAVRRADPGPGFGDNLVLRTHHGQEQPLEEALE
jgi:hypothetical protein